jgi:sensor histidine kinase YesM
MEELKVSHKHSSELERKQSEIKLKMLANQINPHFLYNALESIRMKAHIRGERTSRGRSSCWAGCCAKIWTLRAARSP